MDKPKVSVIIPVYNRRVLLPRAIQSVAMQSWRPLEILIVDNGSTDGTYEEALTMAEELNRNSAGLTVKVLRCEESGAARARNKGFSNATGDIILFFDSDDVMLEGAIESYARMFLNHPEIDMVMASFYWLHKDAKRKKRKLRHRGNLQLNHFHHCSFSTQSFASTRAFLSEVEKRHGELWPSHLGVWDDWALGFRLIMMQPKVKFLSDCVAEVYPQQNSITGEAYCQTAPERYLAAIADVANTIEYHKSRKPRLSKKEYARWRNLLLYRRTLLAALLQRESRKLPDHIIANSAYFDRKDLADESRRLFASVLREAPNKASRTILKACHKYISAGFRGCATFATPLLTFASK